MQNNTCIYSGIVVFFYGMKKGRSSAVGAKLCAAEMAA